MSMEENKAMVRRIVKDVIHEGNLTVADEILAADYVYHFPGNEIRGPEGFKRFATMMRTALPDVTIEIETMVAEGDMVACRFLVRGTQQGEFMGIPPTGKKLEIKEAVFIKFAGGKEVEAWPYMDTLSIYQQLGANPPA